MEVSGACVAWNAALKDILAVIHLTLASALLSAFSGLEEPVTPHCLKSVLCRQRSQRFATYSHLKQMVLRMIVDELAMDGSTSARKYLKGIKVGGEVEHRKCVKKGRSICTELHRMSNYCLLSAHSHAANPRCGLWSMPAFV